MRGEIIHGRHHDEVPHTVLSPDKKTIVSPALDADEKFPHTFTVVGTNADDCCSVHPRMKGRIIVQQPGQHEVP